MTEASFLSAGANDDGFRGREASWTAVALRRFSRELNVAAPGNGAVRHFHRATMIGLSNFIEICRGFPFIMLKKLFLFQNGFRIFSVSTEVDESAAS
jgi:hypothetical protein